MPRYPKDQKPVYLTQKQFQIVFEALDRQIEFMAVNKQKTMFAEELKRKFAEASK